VYPIGNHRPAGVTAGHTACHDPGYGVVLVQGGFAATHTINERERVASRCFRQPHAQFGTVLDQFRVGIASVVCLN
jgi:hypothetical protein